MTASAERGPIPATPPATVAADQEISLSGDRGPRSLWYTEGKEGVYLASRVRPIASARDALTQAEQSVYDILWGPKDQNEDTHRFASMGYSAIAKAARVTKMNAKFIVERLIFKGFARVETLADPLRRIPTRYRVFSYRTALDNMARSNRFHVIRTGNGVLFAHAFQSAMVSAEQATPDTAGKPAAVSFGQSDTIAAVNAHLGSTSSKPQPPSPSGEWPLSAGALYNTFGHGDDDAVRLMAAGALRNAPDATDEEVAHFIAEEAPRVLRDRKLYNPLGLLIQQVPRRFAGEGFRLYREAVRRQRQSQEAARREALAEARLILQNPEAHGAMDVEWARQLLEGEEGGAGKES
jgi:hypothetical protein